MRVLFADYGHVTHIGNGIMKKEASECTFNSTKLIYQYIASRQKELEKQALLVTDENVNVSIQSSKRKHTEVIFFVISFNC